MTDATDLKRFPIPGEGSELRVLLIDGEPWLVAADVAGVLGYRMASDATRLLKGAEKGTHSMRTPSGQQEVTIISEPGFYRLVMRSNRPEADAFQTWVTGEVLPQIRKTGSYRAAPALPASFAEALELAARQARELEAAAGRVAELEPAAEGYAELMATDGTYSLAEAAQALKMGRNQFITLLAEQNMIILRRGHSDHLRPYERARKAGLLALKVRTFTQEHRDGRITIETDTTTRVTPKGLDYIRERRRKAA